MGEIRYTEGIHGAPINRPAEESADNPLDTDNPLPPEIAPGSVALCAPASGVGPSFCPRIFTADPRTIVIGSQTFVFSESPTVNVNDSSHQWGQAPSLEAFHAQLRDSVSGAELEEQFLVVEASDGSVTWYEVGSDSETITSGDLVARTTLVNVDLRRC